MRIWGNMIAAALFVGAVDLWFGATGATGIALAWWPGGPLVAQHIIVMALPLIGLVAGACGVLLLGGYTALGGKGKASDNQATGTAPASGSGDDTLPPWLGTAIGAAAMLLIVAVAGGKAKPVTAATLLLAGTSALLATIRALAALRRGDGVAVDSHWGGLGGALGGWRLSGPTAITLFALLLLGATVALAAIADDVTGNATITNATGTTSAPRAVHPTATAPDTDKPPATTPPTNAAASATPTPAASRPTGDDADGGRPAPLPPAGPKLPPPAGR